MRIFLVCSFLLISVACNKHIPANSGNSTGKGAPVSGEKSIASMNEEVLRYVNQYRQSRRLAPLLVSSAASAEALQHSKDMATNKTAFGHSGFNERVKRVESRIGAVRTAGENVAYGRLTARQVVDGWLKSKAHRTNIEGNYNLIGIGIAKSKSGTLYFTQLFIRL